MLLFFCLFLVVLRLDFVSCFQTSPLRPQRSSISGRHTTIVIHGSVLSKSAILRVSNQNCSKKNSTNKKRSTTGTTPTVVVTKSFLLEAIDEALLRQDLVSEALAKNHEQQKTDTASSSSSSILLRQQEIEESIEKLLELQKHLNSMRSTDKEMISKYEMEFLNLGFQSILRSDPSSSWKTRQNHRQEYGRPNGFDGSIFYTKAGVPILVGKPKAHKDECLRRISQGTDLWFQVEDYNGSRVLLRTSLKRGLKGSKECMQMAADIAARFSDQYDYNDYDDEEQKGINVMYTDSRHVAKRGGKVGQMRQRKSLGRILGYPHNVHDLTMGKAL